MTKSLSKAVLMIEKDDGSGERIYFSEVHKFVDNQALENRTITISGIVIDNAGSGVHQLKKTHCPKGHPYSGANLVMGKNGCRMCRECRQVHNKRNYQKWRERNGRT